MSEDVLPAPDAPVLGPRNGVGRLGLILGITGVLFGLLPLFFEFAVFLGVIGLILALVGLARTGPGQVTNRRTAVGAIATSAGALVLAICSPIVSMGWLLLGYQLDRGDGKVHYDNLRIGYSIGRSTKKENGWSDLDVLVAFFTKSRGGLDEGGRTPKRTYVSFLVEYTCKEDDTSPGWAAASRPCDYSPHDFTVRDESGETYEVVEPLLRPGLGSGTLAIGEQARGYVTFELPDGDHILEQHAPEEDEPIGWPFSV